MEKINNIHVASKYEEYLKTEQFNKIRQEVFSRDNHKCVICGSTENLQAHHLTYINVYQEDTQDLITLCRQCHSIYHAIEKKREAVEEIYKRKRWNEQSKEYEQIQKEQLYEYEREKAESLLIEQEIKDEFLIKDYCSKDGYLDLMDWTILNKIIDQKCKEHNISYFRSNKKELQKYFLYRRCEFFLRCINNKRSVQEVLNKTKFSSQFLSKYYRKDICEAKLKEEKLLKEDF